MPLVDLPLSQLHDYAGRGLRPADFDAYWERQKASLSLPIEEASDPRCRFAQNTP